MTLYDSTMSENTGSYGGGVNNSGTASIINCRFLSNTAPPDFWLNSAGGAIENYPGRLTLIGSVVSGNVSLSGPGGGIYNRGRLTVISSTLSHNEGNSDGGGIYSQTTFTVTNSTLSGNNVVAGERGGGIGGWGKWTIINSTISGNTAQYGGGILCNGCKGSLYNTIVADNPTGGDCVTWSTGIITDGGHNLDSDGSCSLDPANGSLPNTDPLLDELRDNGGPTPTYALLPGSPAIDSADPDHCPASDQRGVPRPIDGDGDGNAVCDMGAYEYDPIPVEADFVARPTDGPPPLTVVFTNTSTGDHDTSLWLFGDGITSTLPGPTHTYTAVGAYTVTLTVDGPGGAGTEVKEHYITVQYGVYLPVIWRSG
jgi:hypothetical protein